MRAFEVTTTADMNRVWALTYQEYLRSSYCEPQPDGLLRHFPHLDGIPETRVFAVEDDDGVMQATNSATVDGVAGLHTDLEYPDETEAERVACFNARPQLRLGSSWRIVTNSGCRGRPKFVRAIVGITIELAGPDQDVTLFTFAKAHARLWEDFLGLKVIAGPRSDKSVNGTPGVLMRGEREVMARQWQRMKK